MALIKALKGSGGSGDIVIETRTYDASDHGQLQETFDYPIIGIVRSQAYDTPNYRALFAWTALFPNRYFWMDKASPYNCSDNAVPWTSSGVDILVFSNNYKTVRFTADKRYSEKYVFYLDKR